MTEELQVTWYYDVSDSEITSENLGDLMEGTNEIVEVAIVQELKRHKFCAEIYTIKDDWGVVLFDTFKEAKEAVEISSKLWNENLIEEKND
jgi:hypothetical protein